MLQATRTVFGIYKDYRGRLILSQVLLLVSALCTLGVATLNQNLINNGLLANDPLVIINTGIYMIVLAVVGAGALGATAALAVFFSQGAAYYLRSELYAKIQEFSFANFDRFRTGNLLVRLNADVLNVANSVQYTVLLLLYAPFMLVVAFGLVIIRMPELLWILLLITVLVAVVLFILIPPIFRAYDERQTRLDELNNTLQENLSGMRVVKAFVREEFEMERFRTRSEAMRDPAFRAAFRVAALNPILTASAQFGVALAVWSGGQQIIDGTGFSVGELVAFMQYVSLVVIPLALMAIVVPFILRGDASAQRIIEVFADEPAIQDQSVALARTPAEISGRVVFDNVTFAFPRPDGELDPPVLRNINLTIEPGQQVGILGATGAGKTALVNLIPRFYDATEGKVTIDGHDVRSFPQDNLREIVGIALQEAVLFQGEVRFNLKFGKPDAPDSLMQEAAKAADAYGFVTNLPEKWEAPVARRGYNFSGGQRQRLSMSRTLTAEPRILILDDSTSALDVATESRVQSAIPVFTDHVTTIYIAQRISAVIELDNIYLMENGQIVAEGTHEELMESSPLYREIYDSQLGGDVTQGVEEA